MSFFERYQSLIVALIPIILPIVFALLRTSKWGKANQDALTKVAEVIETIGDPQLKADVKSKFETASQAQKDALDHAVSVVDPAKTPLSTYERIALDLARVMLPKLKGGK